MAKAKKKKKAPTKKKKEPKEPHLCETGEFDGVLSRDDCYRENARGHLRGAVPNYNNDASILAGIKSRDAYVAGKKKGKDPTADPLVDGKTQQQRVATYKYDYDQPGRGCKNWEDAGVPYSNQAHHIVVCEVFYDKKWTAEHLNVLLQCPYDINNDKNIIYLPQGYAGKTYLCDYHLLPNHALNHPVYNQRIMDECDPIFDKVDEAVKKGDCEAAPDLRDAILKMLQQIEKSNFDYLRTLGPGPMV